MLVELILFLFLVTTYFNFNNVNFYAHSSCLFSEDINSLLLNSINKIHPLLLYLSGISFLQFFFNLNTLLINKINKNFFVIYLNCVKLKSGILNTLFTLYLGCWWAFQEGSWGG